VTCQLCPKQKEIQKFGKRREEDQRAYQSDLRKKSDVASSKKKGCAEQ